MQVEYIKCLAFDEDYSLIGVVRVTWPFFILPQLYLWNWWSWALQISCADWYIYRSSSARII